MGVTWPASHLTAGELLPRLSSLARRRFPFLWPLPGITSPGGYPASSPMESGLSSALPRSPISLSVLSFQGLRTLISPLYYHLFLDHVQQLKF